jgi:hypothetical protein
MPKRFVIGLVMMLSGLGLLTPPLWMLCSPFLSHAIGFSSSALTAWVAATLGGMTLLVFGVRRLIPIRLVRSRSNPSA